MFEFKEADSDVCPLVNTTGRSGLIALIWVNASVPLRPGIATSRITRSILVGSCVKSRSASRPSAARIVV